MWNKNFLSLLCVGLVTATTQAIADDTPAVYFAKQAGVVAGAAEACGQPISIMVMRAGEVIDTLITDPMDKTYATAAFESSRQKSHDSMIQSQQITCPKVISDFNSLPLLQPDYRTTVIQPLAASKIGNPATPTATTANNNQPTATTNPAAGNPSSPVTPSPTMPAQQNTTAPANPAVNQVLPANTATPQKYVAGTNSVANSNLPPINPTYVPPNSPLYPGAPTSQDQTEIAKLQLAQQLAQMAQTLVTQPNNPSQVSIGAGQPSSNNALYNPALNEHLNGTGANNPIFTGGSLGNGNG